VRRVVGKKRPVAGRRFVVARSSARAPSYSREWCTCVGTAVRPRPFRDGHSGRRSPMRMPGTSNELLGPIRHPEGRRTSHKTPTARRPPAARVNAANSIWSPHLLAQRVSTGRGAGGLTRPERGTYWPVFRAGEVAYSCHSRTHRRTASESQALSRPNHPGGNRRQERMLIELVAFLNVGDVHFDQRLLNELQRI
jgi:hypothetical protein